MIQVKRSHFYLNGKRLKLAGNHTWNTVQPIAGEKVSLDRLTGNFTRLWTVETYGMRLDNQFYGSQTSGLARVKYTPWNDDGSLNDRYYRSLRRVVRQAEEKDMIVGVVLFDHAFNAYFDNGWQNHPLNGLGPTDPTQIHTKGKHNIYQRNHVKRVVSTLEKYSNVIYEVGNELHRNSISWFQSKVIQWVKKWTTKPVGASYAAGVFQDQSWLKRVGADWIAPSNSERAGGVKKVAGFKGPQVLDTDHAWALRSNVSGLKSANSQFRPLWLMDGLDGTVLNNYNSLTPDRNFINSLFS